MWKIRISNRIDVEFDSFWFQYRTCAAAEINSFSLNFLLKFYWQTHTKDEQSISVEAVIKTSVRKHHSSSSSPSSEHNSKMNVFFFVNFTEIIYFFFNSFNLRVKGGRTESWSIQIHSVFFCFKYFFFRFFSQKFPVRYPSFHFSCLIIQLMWAI